MRQSLIKFLKENFFAFLLVLLVVFLSFVNYTPGTWLSGWDTLHPEFDFLLNLKRTFFGVWRQEQGVGALPGHSHISEIPRILVLWLSSLFINTQFLRYFYFFAMLILGPLGVYFFLNYSLNKDKGILIRGLASFLGASYYLLNLGTLQHFYVPFEMFATQFGLLPWLFLLALKYLNKGKRTILLAFFALSFIAAPQAYASTLFYAYFAGLVIFLFSQVILNPDRVLGIKRAITICFVILTTNAFWLLPNIYSVVKQSKVIENSKINTLFSPEAFLRNAEYGRFSDLILHKNFLFDWREYDEGKGEFVDLMNEWNNYLGKPVVVILGYGLAAMFLVGLGFSLIKLDKIGISLSFVGLFAAFFLINDNPPTGFIYSYLRDNLGVFREGFRTPFTKFSILFIFVASYFFAYFQSKALLFLNQRLKAIAAVGLVVLVFGSLVLFMKPAFEGNFISPSMRINIPSEYFQAQDWFNVASEGRVAKFPVNSLWGWIYYSWGFEGAGFNWFGNKNPSFDRDFDRWSGGNETFYNQASSAVYSKDLKALEEVLEKFGVRYLLLDTSVINPGGNQDLTYTKETKELFEASEHIKKDVEFGSLSIYETDFTTGTDYLVTPESYLLRGVDLTYSTKDPIYEEGKAYIEDYKGLVYPFVNYDKRQGLITSIGDEKVILENKFKEDLGENVKLLVADYPKTEKFLAVEVSANQINNKTLEATFTLKSPEILINGSKVAGGKFYYQIHPIRLLTGKPVFVSVKDTVFSLGEEEDKPLGRVMVGAKEPVNVSIYSEEGASQEEFKAKILSAQPRWCSNPDKKIQASEGEEVAFGVGPESVCWGEGTYLNQPGLIKVSFESSSLTGLSPKFCMSTPNKVGCVNSSVPDSFSKEGNWSKSEFLIPVAAGNYWIDFVAQGQQGSPGQISFRNIAISKYPVIGGGIYSLGENFTLVSSEEEVEIAGKVESVAVNIPKVVIESERASLGRGHAKALNCDLKKEGVVEKKIEGKRIYYSAKDTAASCDYLDYPNLDHSQSYLLRVNGENILGRGLKIYLQNMTSKKMDLEELLPSGGKVDENFFVPPALDGGKGYVFNFETRSFGPSTSSNYLDGVEFLNIPYDWLTQLRFKGKGPSEKVNSISIGNVQKTGFYKYNLELKGNGLLVLNQGYENGWIALSGRERLKHVKVNSWSNGWIIPEGTTKVTIVFWPQYLEYIGFGILALGLLGVIFIKEVDKADNNILE